LRRRLPLRDNQAIDEQALPDTSPAAPPGTRSHGPLQRLADWIVPPENPSGIVYGVLVIGALLAAESGRHETYIEAIGSAAIAAAVYWLAHAYATGLGRRLGMRERLTAGSLWRALVHDWALIRGASIPLLVLVVAWAAGAAQASAVDAALWSAVASLIVFELIAGIRSRATPRELALEIGVGGVLALGILSLKIVLH
jgi:hypothetical protein